MKRHTTCGVWTPQVPIVAKCPLGAIIAQSIGFPCTHEECRLLRCHQATTTPCRRVHRPRGQSPVGVSRRHRWPRSAHARRTTDPHPPSGVSPQLGSVPGGGQSPSQMCTLDPRPTNPPQMGPIAWCGQFRDGVSRRHKCARSAHARRTPGPHPPGGVSPRVGSVPGGGQSPSQMCTVRAGVLLSPPSRSSRPCAAGRRPARDRRTYIGSGAHYTADADN